MFKRSKWSLKSRVILLVASVALLGGFHIANPTASLTGTGCWHAPGDDFTLASTTCSGETDVTISHTTYSSYISFHGWASACRISMPSNQRTVVEVLLYKVKGGTTTLEASHINYGAWGANCGSGMTGAGTSAACYYSNSYWFTRNKSWTENTSGSYSNGVTADSGQQYCA